MTAPGTTERTSINPAELAAALSGGTSALARAPQLATDATRSSATRNRRVAAVTVPLSVADASAPVDGRSALLNILHPGRDLGGNGGLVVLHCLCQGVGFR